jgi:hypothetical protein
MSGALSCFLQVLSRIPLVVLGDPQGCPRHIACLDPRNSFANYDKEKLMELAKLYDDDFCDYNLTRLREQLDVWINEVRRDPKFANCHDIGDLAIQMVQIEMNKDYKFVYRLVELALILPVATATVERIFSAMKIIKKELRNKMGNDWLNHRMICYIEREIFASMKMTIFCTIGKI